MIVAAEYVGGVFRPLGPVALTEGTRVELEILEPADPFVIVSRITAKVPEGMPTDGSTNHDHYLYGAERRG